MSAFPSMTDLALEISVPGPGLPNLIQNPSGEFGGWGWLTPISGNNMQGILDGSGNPLLKFTTGAQQASHFTTEAAPVAAGRWVGARFEITSVLPAGHGVRARFVFYNADMVLLSSGAQSAYFSTIGVKYVSPMVAPANTAFVVLRVDLYSTSGGANPFGTALVQFRQAMLTHSPTDPGVSYDFSEPYTYLDVIGPTSSIKVERTELNVSTLEATIEDSALDPAQTDTIRPGKRVRLTTSGGEVLFTGKVLAGTATYNPLRGTTRIVLTGVDAAAALAQVARPDGVAAISALRYMLEGAGVPWNVDGLTYHWQGPPPPIVATNENAKAIDQIAITRDSHHGYAWVNRFGVINVWSANLIPSVPVGTLDESDYNANLDVSFDADRSINEITIKHLRVNLATGETVEVPYGPYRDQASIDEWDVHSAEFTVQGLVDDEPTMAAFAAEVFAANAQPQERINSIQLPIRSAVDVTQAKALLDLYDLLTVTNANTGLNQTARVTALTHEIRPGRWLVTVGFSIEGNVAAPQATPALVSGLASGSAVVDAVKSWEVAQSADVAKSDATNTALPGISVTVNPASTETVYHATLDADVLIGTAGTVNIIELVVDGVAIASPAIITQGAQGTRIAGSKRWRVTGLAPGPRTITAQTRNTAGGSGATVRNSHTVLSVTRET